MLKKSKQFMAGMVAAAVLVVPGMVNAEEAEVVKEEVKEVEVVASLTKGLNSNNDAERRAALEKEFNVKLTDTMVWKDKKGETTRNPNGTLSEYTGHDTMKSLGIYAVNANRQELIQYAIQEGDWQPYRALAAKETPGHFEMIDGKYEYNKIFYGQLISSYLSSYKAKVTELNMKGASTKEAQEELNAEKAALKAEHDFIMGQYVEDFNNAPGIVPYIVHFNHREDVAKEYGVEMVADGYFDSKYNNPELLTGRAELKGKELPTKEVEKTEVVEGKKEEVKKEETKKEVKEEVKNVIVEEKTFVFDGLIIEDGKTTVIVEEQK